MMEDMEKTAIGTIESTQMMTAPGAEATQYAANVECPVCHTPNPPSETYCIDCGFLLASDPVAAGEVEETPSLGTLVTADGTREFPLKPGQNAVGRQDADILLMHSTVSRRHAVVTVEDGKVFVEDLGSTNGTTVDGRKLEPNERVELSDGREVVFGSQALRLQGIGCQVSGDGESQSSEDETPHEPEDAASIAPSPGAEGWGEGAVPEPNEEEATPSPLAGEGWGEGDAEAEQSPEPSSDAQEPDEPKAAPAAVLVGTAGDLRFDLCPGTLSVGRRDGNDIVIPDPYASGRHAEISVKDDGFTVTDLGSTNGTMVNGVKLEPNAPREVQIGDEITFGQTVFRIEAVA